MSVNRRFETWSWARRATLAGALLLSVLTVPLGLAAQAPSQFLIMPGCFVPPPPPANDGYPMAVTDALQTTASTPLAFTGATLLANDTGAAPLAIASVGAASAAGGTITGSGPYTYRPAAGYTGADSFSYQIQNVLGSAVGVVNVTVSADLVLPTVALTSPAAGSVGSSVLVAASASDNAGVAGVTFFDGTTPIGGEVTASPYQVTWNTLPAANGPHTLTAVARDINGNSATSAAVAVNVSNVVLTAPVVEKMIVSDGAGKRTTAAFSTTHTNDVLVAFAASDGPAAANGQTLTVSGAGLTWTRVRRAATQFGDSEIWTATAPALLTNVTVSSTQASSSRQSLTVIVFSGASGVGASAAGGAASGGAAASLVTTSVNSLVYAVGNDWDSAAARTVAAGQVKVREVVDTTSGDTFWVQSTSAAVVAAGTSVAMGTTSPTLDQWNFAAVEVKAGVAPPPPAQVTVPTVVGQAQNAAQAALTTAGLTSTVTTANSATVPAGSVISQNPTGGSSAAAGSAVALSVSLGPAAPPPPAAGPVLALSFNEASGATVGDSSGNGNNGTIAGATRVTGQVGFGGALSFDGVSSIVNVAHSASLALSSGMTLEAWVNPSENAGTSVNDGWRTVIMKERSTTGLAYGLYSNDGDSNPSRPAGYVRNSATDKEAAAGPAVPVAVWTHLAVTYDGTSIRLYVNGVLRSTTGSAGGGINASTAPLRIGGNTVFSVPGTEYFAGLIDEVRIYNRALSAAEITADMNTPLP